MASWTHAQLMNWGAALFVLVVALAVMWSTEVDRTRLGDARAIYHETGELPDPAPFPEPQPRKLKRHWDEGRAGDE